MQKYIWEIKIKTDTKDAKEIVKEILKSRNIENPEEITHPLHPLEFAKTDSLFKELKSNIENAAKIIKDTINRNYPIIIHGDYDVDGQSATAILWRTIYNDLNYKNIFPFIPNRTDHGYGLSQSSILEMENLLKSKGLDVKDSLIVTVDCAITASKEATIAKEKGFKIIITDHHTKSDKLPQPDELIWTDKATGSGISWLLAQELTNYKDKSKYLDLACLGTICDLQPILGFNRSIVKYGLLELKENKITGVQVLKEFALIKNDIDTYEVGWVIGPRLNASGRLSDAINSLRLLSTDSVDQAKEIANDLTQINKKRQDKTQNDFLIAVKEYEDLDVLPSVISSFSNTYHDGIIGLIASKLTQTFNRPSIVVAIEEDKNIAKGSGRSVEGISIIKELRNAKDIFISLGGHEMACGFSLEIEKIGLLKDFLKSLDNTFDDSLFNKKLKIDLEIESGSITKELYSEISSLKPFGVGFVEPVFVTKDLIVTEIFNFGQDNKHVKFKLSDSNFKTITGVFFNKAETADTLDINDRVSVVYTLSENNWNNKSVIELKIKDLAKTG